MKTSLEHLEAAAACLRTAGFSLYLAQDMGGTKFSDNVMQGDQPAHVSNIQPWCVARRAGGDLAMRVAVRGDAHGLYEPHSDTIAENEVDALAQRIFWTLRAAGMRIRRVRNCAGDTGFGTHDIHYEITYELGGSWS
jgi:hypothetical protein